MKWTAIHQCTYMYMCRHNNYYYTYTRETIKEPQLPKHERGLDVTLRVTQCAGRVSANTRLRWDDSVSLGATWHAHATDGWPHDERRLMVA